MKRKQIAAAVCVVIVLLVLFSGVSIMQFGGFAQFYAYICGKAVYLSPKVCDLGQQQSGTQTVAVFHLTNLTLQEISVVGEKSSCKCAFLEQLPIIVAPGQTQDIKINIHLPLYDSSYNQTVTLMIAEPKRLAMHTVQITASVTNPIPKPPTD